MNPRQLVTVRRVREHRRDQVRLVLAQLLAEHSSIGGRIEQTQAEQLALLAELRAASALGKIDVDRMAAARYHIGRLSIEIARLTASREASARHLQAARAALASADRDVKVIERLQERRQEIARHVAERAADREATDRYTAARSFEQQQISGH